MKHNELLVYPKGNQLMEQVYTILDSRIQYMEYQAKKQCNFEGINEIYLSNSTSTSSPTASLIDNFDQMLVHLQELNQSLKLLQILKHWLKDDNVQLVFQLLNNKTYLNYTEESLESYLKGKNVFRIKAAN